MEIKKMQIGFTAGSKAVDNYYACCTLFEFDPTLAGAFKMMKMLYAQNATPEGYSVWMLAHSNLNESFNKKKNWYNMFVHPNEIKEIWFNPEDIKGSQHDYSKRVCFAKNKNGNYVFQGVYEPQKIEWEIILGEKQLVRTFKRISATYPIEYATDEKTIPAVNILQKHAQSSFAPKVTKMTEVVDKCKIKAYVLEKKQETTLNIDLSMRPFQNAFIGKKVGDEVYMTILKLTYRIDEIFREG